MSSDDLIFIHFIRSFEQFPRVTYFVRRFTDLTPRFFNIQAALPSNFFVKTENDQLKKLTDALGRRITIIVYGSRDIPDTDLGISKALQSTADKGAGTDLGISKALQSAADEGAADLDGITIIILTAEFENIDHNTEKTLESIADQFSRSSAKDKLWSFELLIVYFRVTEKCSLMDDQLNQFRINVKQKLDLILRNSISLKNILVEQKETNIQLRISDVLEDLVIDNFCAIKEVLQRFIRRDQSIGIQYSELIEDVDLAGEIKLVFEDRMSILDMHNVTKDKIPSTDILISKLTTVVKCAAIPLLAKRFTIPDGICNDLLQESKFEENLYKAMKPDTAHRLGKIYEQILAQAEEQGVQQKFSSSDDFVDIVKADWKEVFERTERIFGSMNRVITVMKNMIFEIEGYLKQSKKYKDLTLPDMSHQLTDDLRKQLLSIEGVYGVGHIYGQLEIHANVKENEFPAVQELVNELLHNYNFQESYSVKRIEANIK